MRSAVNSELSPSLFPKLFHETGCPQPNIMARIPFASCMYLASLASEQPAFSCSAVGGYFGGQLTPELMIAKFLEPRTSDFIKPLHGN